MAYSKWGWLSKISKHPKFTKHREFLMVGQCSKYYCTCAGNSIHAGGMYTLKRWVAPSSQLCRLIIDQNHQTQLLSTPWTPDDPFSMMGLAWLGGGLGILLLGVHEKKSYARGQGWHDDIVRDFNHIKCLTKKVLKRVMELIPRLF